MEKRTFLAIILSISVLIGFQTIFANKSSKNILSQEFNPQTDANKGVVSFQKEIPSEAGKESGKKKSASTPRKPEIIETISFLKNDILSIGLSNVGGAVVSVNLKGKAVSPIPASGFSALKEFEFEKFETVSIDSDRIVFRYADDDVEIKKTYELSKQSNILTQKTTVSNISEMSIVKSLDFIGLKVNSGDIRYHNPQENGLYEYSISNGVNAFRKNDAYKFNEREYSEKVEAVKWIGYRDRYYCSIFKNNFSTKGYRLSPSVFPYVVDTQKDLFQEGEVFKFSSENDIPPGFTKDMIFYVRNPVGNKFNISLTPSGSLVESSDLTMILTMNPQTLDPGEKISMDGEYYFGLQDMKGLKEAGFGDFLVFSKYGLLDLISKSVIKLLIFCNKFIPSLGFCIILVSVLIYGAMYPLTMSGMMSMRKMQALQPKMAKLKEQYKNNPQKLNQEVMDLYKQNSINPLGGCLPFLLQMPIFIGLYQALWRSVIFQGHGFLWIKDLSLPDNLFKMPFVLPFIGDQFNILPLVMMVAMFFQQKLSSKNMVMTDESQILQQKIMLWFFPIFLGILFYKFSSGLNIYFTVFYTLSTLTQLKMSKMNVISDK